MLHSVDGGYAQKPAVVAQLPAKTQQNVVEIERSSSNSIASDRAGVRVEYQSSLVTYSRPSGVQAYQQVNPANATSAASDKPDSNNPYSSAILAAIEGQLLRDQRDGASFEEMQSRLEAGLEGFLEGYNQALDQLGAIAEFTPDIAADIATTREQVLRGISGLADKLGLEVPSSLVGNREAEVGTQVQTAVATDRAVSLGVMESKSSLLVKQEIGNKILSSAMRDMKTLEQLSKRTEPDVYGDRLRGDNLVGGAQRYEYQVSETRDFDFNLTTQDGDIVTIKMMHGQSGLASFSDAAGLIQAGEQSSSFQFEVDGELDVDELRAITDLLDQVGDISEFFFNGDIDGAIASATQLSYNNGEISTFDVNLSHSVSEAAGVTAADDIQTPVGIAGPSAERFVEQVDYAGQLAENLSQPRSLVADLTDWVAQQLHARDPWSQHAGAFVKAFL